MPRIWSALVALSLLALGACGGDDDPSGAGGAGGSGDPCGQDVPLVSWETFAEGFLSTYCQGCHAAASPDRKGAPENIIFDTEADALMWRDTILDVATSDNPRMPPSGGPSADEREKLAVWLTCFSE